MNIPGFRGAGIREVIVKSVKDFVADDMASYAAALAYAVLFAIFPFLIFLIALLGVLEIPQFFDWLLEQASFVLPPQAMVQLDQVLGEIQTQGRGGLLSFGILLTLWTASGGVRATMNAMNVAYDVAESRPIWKLYPLSILYTLGLAAMLILAVGLMILGPQVMGRIAEQVGLGPIFVTIWAWARWPIAVLLLMVALAIIYYVCPNVTQPFRIITPGAALAVLTWIAASVGFSYYISNFADYSATYGSIGAVIVLLFYFYLTALVLLLGAEINATIAELSADPEVKTDAPARSEVSNKRRFTQVRAPQQSTQR